VSTFYSPHLIISSVQLYANQFPVLARIARDILAIPGVSISVERLFSSSKHTLSDARSSLSAKSGSKTVVAKEWLKRGFGEGMNYLDDIHTHS
jgi:hAT family C-terminal dimerisation region